MGDRGRDADVLLGGWGYQEPGRVEDEDAIVNRVMTPNEGGVGGEEGLARGLRHTEPRSGVLTMLYQRVSDRVSYISRTGTGIQGARTASRVTTPS